jgi:hypothetical protein
MSTPKEALKRPLTSDVIAGANVALAIVATVILTLSGQPSVAWPICTMVAAVYGVSNTIKLFQKQG